MRPRALPASAPLVLGTTALAAIGGSALGLPAAVVALVAGPVCLVHAAWLVRLGVRIRSSAAHRSAGRGLPALAVGLLGTGILVAVPPQSWLPGAGPVAVVAAVATVVGFLLLPGVAADRRRRRRQSLDGLCVALWKFVTLWVLVLEAIGVSALTFTVCLLACVGLTLAVLSGVRAPYPRGAALTAAAGVIAIHLALSILLLLPPLGPQRAAWVSGAAALVVVGAVALWAGAWRDVYRRQVDARPAAPIDVDECLVGDPLLVAPVVAGAAAVGYRLLTGGISLITLVILGAAVVAVTVRELLEIRRVRRFSGQLAVQEARFRSLVAGSTDVILVLDDDDLSVRWQSPAAARQFGLSDQEVTGRPFTDLVHPDDLDAIRAGLHRPAPDGSPGPQLAHLLRARVRDGFGRWRHTEFTVSDLRGTPEVRALVVHLRDVGDRRELEDAVRRMSRTDQLTGLVNRDTLLGEMGCPTAGGTLLMIGLDGFGAIVDVHGPAIGDAMLVEVAGRIRAVTESTDVAARLGGDEFAVLTRVGAIRTYTLATRMLAELTRPYRLPGVELHLSADIGLADVAAPDRPQPAGSEPAGTDTAGPGSAGTETAGSAGTERAGVAQADRAQDALRRAGLALRRARHGGRGQVEWHDEAIEAAYVRRAVLAQDLPGALDRGEFDLAFQPVYDLVGGHPVGVEALLRWRHPRLGTVAPLETIAVARELNLVAEVGTWTLNRACRQLSRWQHDGYRLWMSVNVSFEELVAEQFAAGLSLALDSNQLEPADLVIELAEQQLQVGLEEAITPLATVRALGVRTALDGFGTAGTALAHLRRLPADLIKVDQSLFAEPPGAGRLAAPILDVVVELGRRLGVDVVAHGLESPSHLEVVRAAGCRYGQGHLYGQPVPAERIEAELVYQQSS